MSAARGDRFEAIYRAHQDAVHAYLLRRAEPELAQDALSETFLAAWRRLDELPSDPCRGCSAPRAGASPISAAERGG